MSLAVCPFSRGTAVRPASLPTCTKPFSPDALSAQSWGRAVEMRGDCQCEHSYHCVECTCVITTTKSSRRRTSATHQSISTFVFLSNQKKRSNYHKHKNHIISSYPTTYIYLHACLRHTQRDARQDRESLKKIFRSPVNSLCLSLSLSLESRPATATATATYTCPCAVVVETHYHAYFLRFPSPASVSPSHARTEDKPSTRRDRDGWLAGWLLLLHHASSCDGGLSVCGV